MNNIILVSILLLFSVINLNAQQSAEDESCNEYYRVAFWNVENYFDAETDSTKKYSEFNKGGERNWTPTKYQAKRNNIYKTMTAMGGWIPLTMIGFAEIENEFILTDLIESTPLRDFNYKVIHYESNDLRGIDVGFVYLADKLTILFSKKIPIIDSTDANFTTRDILYVKGLLGSDTLHIFINHWTSRYRGFAQSEPLRVLAASVLRKTTDSICKQNPESAILIMGDLNDNANNESISLFVQDTSTCSFVDLPLKISNNEVKGTLKFQGKWDIFDHLIVSRHLLESNNGLAIKNQTGNVFSPDFLLEKDEKYLGIKPKRTYLGYKYNAGISDHLPVYIDIYKPVSK